MRKTYSRTISLDRLYKDEEKVLNFSLLGLVIPLKRIGLFKEGDIKVLTLVKGKIAYTIKLIKAGEGGLVLIEEVYDNQPTKLNCTKKGNSEKSRQHRISQEHRQILSQQPDKDSLFAVAEGLGISKYTSILVG